MLNRFTSLFVALFALCSVADVTVYQGSNAQRTWSDVFDLNGTPTRHLSWGSGPTYTNGCLTPLVMTSSNAPSPFVAYSSDLQYPVQAAWLAFDKDQATFFDGAPGTVTWLAIDIGTARVLTSYSIRGWLSASYTVNAWVLSGSNNGADWTQIDSRTGITGWESYEVKAFSVTPTPTPTPAYRYFKLSALACDVHPDEPVVSEIELYGLIP